VIQFVWNILQFLMQNAMPILFGIIAFLGLAAALGTVLARNLVHAALFLVAFFFTIACQFVLLEAEFLAALQVLVYIGAVAILLMFGIMLTRNIQGDDPKSTPSAWQVPGLVAGLFVFLVLAYGIVFQRGLGGQKSWSMTDTRPSIAPDANRSSSRATAVDNMAKVVGDELLTRYVVGFEVAGLLLTAALVGAIAVAHREEEDPVVPGGRREAVRKPGAPPPVDGEAKGPAVEATAAATSTAT
jgi:NADH:ubiquinone oxidoreductase subunit 6 (subunit J)